MIIHGIGLDKLFKERGFKAEMIGMSDETHNLTLNCAPEGSETISGEAAAKSCKEFLM